MVSISKVGCYCLVGYGRGLMFVVFVLHHRIIVAETCLIGCLHYSSFLLKDLLSQVIHIYFIMRNEQPLVAHIFLFSFRLKVKLVRN